MRFGAEGRTVRILYGGSVIPSNPREIVDLGAYDLNPADDCPDFIVPLGGVPAIDAAWQ
jgi:hypothetical protein